MPQSELDSHTDALLRDIVLGLQGKYPFEEWEPFGDPTERFPHTVAAIGTYVEREAERLAVERPRRSGGPRRGCGLVRTRAKRAAANPAR